GSGSAIELPNGGALGQMVTPIYLIDVDNTIIDGLNLAWTGSATRTGTGIYSERFSDNVTIQNVDASNRATGIQFINNGAYGGSDLILSGNNLSNTNVALDLHQIVDGADADNFPLLISGNTFTGSGQALRLDTIAGASPASRLTIGVAGSGSA